MGDRAIPELFIQHPIGGTDQPAAIIRTFVNAWQTWRNSEARKEAREISEKKEWRSSRKRLRRRKFLLRGKQKRAEEIHRWLKQDWKRWCELSHEQQTLWREFRNYEIWDVIDEVKMQQAQW